MSKLGNPAAIMAATEIAKSKQGQEVVEKSMKTVENTQRFVKKAGKVTAITFASLVLLYGTVKATQIIRRNALLNKAAGDPEIKSAIDIWESIPDGFKNKFKFIQINPLKKAQWAYEEIETLWKDTNTSRIMKIAKNIHAGQYKINKISRHFKTLYKIDLMTMLNKVLTTDQIDMFSNFIYRGSGSVTPKVANGQYAVSKVAVRLRTEPSLPSFWESDNTIKTVDAGKVIGQVTGREETFNDGDKSVIFVEILTYDSNTNIKKYSRPVWAWKGAFNFVTKDEIKNLSHADTKKPASNYILETIPLYNLAKKLF